METPGTGEPDPDLMPITASQSLAAALQTLAESRDPEAWSHLVTLAGADIHNLCRRILGDANLADDATQETLLRVRDGAHVFTGGRIRPDDDANESARRWILRIACTTALKMLRTRKRVQVREQSYANARALSESRNPNDAEMDAEAAEKVRREVDALPEQQRLPILFHYYAGLEYAQIAAELGCPVGTAKTNVHRGIEKLRARMAVLGLVLTLEQFEPLLRAPAVAKSTAAQLATWKALLTAPKLAAATSVAATGGISLMAKLCIGSAVAVLATVAAVTASKAFPAASTAPMQAATPVVAPAVTPPGAMNTAISQPAVLQAIPKWDDGLRAKLEPRATFDFVDTDLNEALAFLSHISKAQITISDEAQKSDTVKKSISLRVTDAPIERCLRLIAYLTGSEVKYKDGAVVFDVATTPRAARELTPTAEDEATRRKLQRHVTFEFADQTLGDAVNFLNSLTKVNMVIGPDVNIQAPITLRSSDQTLEHALFWSCMASKTHCHIEEGIVFIENGEDLSPTVNKNAALDATIAEPLTGLSVEKAIAAAAKNAKVAVPIDPAALALIKDKNVENTTLPTGEISAGLALDALANANGLEIGIEGAGLVVKPHVIMAFEADIVKAGSNKVTFDFHDADAKWVANSLFILIGKSIVMLPGVEGKKVSFHADDMKLPAALRNLLAPAGLTFGIKNEAIVIGKPEDIWRIRELPATAADAEPNIRKPEPGTPKKDEF